MAKNSKGFFNKIENKGGKFLGKIEHTANKIANKADDALKIGGKILEGAEKLQIFYQIQESQNWVMLYDV